MAKGRKRSDQQQGAPRKGRQRRSTRRKQFKQSKEPINWDVKLEKATEEFQRNKEAVESGETYASQRQRSREQSPGRTDGVWYG